MFNEQLFALQDHEYQAFQVKLIPSIPSDTIIGVRIPQLRRLAKQLNKEEQGKCAEFLKQLPHHYYEENLLHAFLIAGIKDFDRAVELTQEFLPYIDNWAVCDSFQPKAFGNHHDEVLILIRQWIRSEHVYTVRFAIGLLLSNYLDTHFAPEQLDLVATIGSDEYYVKMMQAWYFATALAKQYDKAIPYLTEHRLPKWVRNKAIQKACESYRIDNQTKCHLRQLRIK